jgi:hypothetical protein
MAMKRIKKDQIDAGKKELPRKLQFLEAGRVAYTAVLHDADADEWLVELPLASAKKLARSAADLKELKSAQKELTAQAAQVPRLMKDRAELATLRESSAAMEADFKKALRRVRALEKALGLDPGGKVQLAKPAEQSKPAKAPEVNKKAAADPIASIPVPGTEGMPVQTSAAATDTTGPRSKLKPLAKAAKKATDAPGLPEHSAAALPISNDSAAPAV